MNGCPGPGSGTDRAYRRLARLGEDPGVTLDDPPDPAVTAELPAVEQPLVRHRHRAPSRPLTVRRVALAVTGAALLASMGIVLMMTPGDDQRPGVTSVPPPVVTSEPEPAPSSPRPNLVLPPAPSRTREPEPSTSTSSAPPSSPASPAPSPTRRAQSPAPPSSPPGEQEEPPPVESPGPSDSPTPSNSPTTTPS